jgi:phospholipase C
VNTINALQKTPDWKSTAVIVSYDDSDGWYDHAFSGVTNPSTSVADALTGTGMCGSGTPLAGQNGRCGYGPRLPLLVISPWAKRNFVSNTLTSQTSITKFIEDNWLNGQRIPGSFDSITGSIDDMFQFFSFHHRLKHPENGKPFILNPVTGQPAARWQ